jgi:hypothetical protein
VIDFFLAWWRFDLTGGFAISTGFLGGFWWSFSWCEVQKRGPSMVVFWGLKFFLGFEIYFWGSGGIMPVG